MTGFDSKRQAAQDKVQEEMKSLYTKRQAAQAKLDDDDDTQVYADTLLIVYQRGFADGKKAAQRNPLTEDELQELFSGTAGFRQWALTAPQIAFARAIEAAHGIKKQS